MPEVQEFAFVSKKLALQRFKKRLGKNDSIVVRLRPTPCRVLRDRREERGAMYCRWRGVSSTTLSSITIPAHTTASIYR